MKAVIEIPFESNEMAKNAFQALEGELTFKKRAKPEIKQDKNKVIITIHADDISSLHATTGTFMRALKVVLSVQSKK